MRSYIVKIKTYFTTASIYLSASLISSFLSILINPLLAMNLSPEDYAVSTYYSSFGLLYGPVMAFFITDFYLRKYYLLSKEDLFILKGNVIKIFLVFSGLLISLISDMCHCKRSSFQCSGISPSHSIPLSIFLLMAKQLLHQNCFFCFQHLNVFKNCI